MGIISKLSQKVTKEVAEEASEKAAKKRIKKEALKIKKKKNNEEIEETHPTKKYYRKMFQNKKQRMELFGDLYEN